MGFRADTVPPDSMCVNVKPAKTLSFLVEQVPQIKVKKGVTKVAYRLESSG